MLFFSSVISCGSQQKENLHTWNLFNTAVWKDVPITWQFHCEFPNKFKDDVRDGFDYWDNLTQLDLFSEDERCWVGDDLVDRYHIVVTYSMVETHKTDNGNIVLAWAYKNWRNGYISWGEIRFIKVWFKRSKALRRTMSRHEVGHILGMSHVEIKQCIMYPTVYNKDGLKKACDREIKEFLERYERFR